MRTMIALARRVRLGLESAQSMSRAPPCKVTTALFSLPAGSPLRIFGVSRIDNGVAVRVSALLSVSTLGAGVLKVIFTDLSECLDAGFGRPNLP